MTSKATGYCHVCGMAYAHSHRCPPECDPRRVAPPWTSLTKPSAQKTISVLVADRDQWQKRALTAESKLSRTDAGGCTVREAELLQSLNGSLCREGEQRDEITSLRAKLANALRKCKELEG